nr:MAG: VP1 [Parvoviridae sp.]
MSWPVPTSFTPPKPRVVEQKVLDAVEGRKYQKAIDRHRDLFNRHSVREHPPSTSGEHELHEFNRRRPQENQEVRQRRPNTRPPSLPDTGSRTPLLPRVVPNPGVGIGINPAAVGVAGAVTGLAAGGIISGITKLKKEGITLPGTDYVGPGNPINIDAPRHNLDAIAKEHDVEYDRLLRYAQLTDLSPGQFKDLVSKADSKAIEAFHKDFEQSGDWRSFIAKHGLRIKQRLEDHIGSIYPQHPGQPVGELWLGKIYLLIRNLIMAILTKAKNVTLGSNINSLLLDEDYLLIILFQT